MNEPQRPSVAFHRYSKIVAVFTFLLIWVGAAVTTEEAGMVFADWPFSNGSINPPGWLQNVPQFLEHSHRLIATTVGLLVLGMFAWAFVNGWRRVLELTALVLVLAAAVELFRRGGAERIDAGRKAAWFLIASLVSFAPVAWLIHGWLRRNWPTITKLSALALLMVVVQAIFGGMRVTEISDSLAALHGCFGQAFFCVVILAVMASSPKRQCWKESVHRRRLPALQAGSTLLLGSVFVQLILGALMRHHHRSGLADTGIFLTDGKVYPSFETPMLGILFLHKYWALIVFGVAISLAVWATSSLRDHPRLRKLTRNIVLLIVLQIALGVSVILTGKSFWMTNLHVINGLFILAAAFILLVRCYWCQRALAAATRLERKVNGVNEAAARAEALPEATT